MTKSLKSNKVESQNDPASDKQSNIFSSADPGLRLKTREAQQGVSSCKTDSKTDQGTGSCKTSYTNLDSDIPKRRLDAPPHHQEHQEHRGHQEHHQAQPVKEPQ